MRDMPEKWNENKKASLELKLFRFLNEFELVNCFSNVEISLRIYLCMFVTNCTGERSFSKLKLILSYLGNTMGQDRLSSLALLSIENKILHSIDMTDVLEKFVRQKARKNVF